MEVRSVEAIVSALNEAGMNYLVVGGLAVNAHGYARMTREVNLVVRLDPGNILRALSAMTRIGYQMAIPATARKSSPILRRADAGGTRRT